jgi:hypothetical protein
VEKQCNTELHGTDGAISLETRWRKRETALEEAVSVYQNTIGNVSPTDSSVLHHKRVVDEILKWTKEHLDTYLASDVIIEQRDEPS